MSRYRKFVPNGDKHQKATPTYATYRGMIQRCTNPKAINYQRYGGKGIKVCDRWLKSFENFVDDMGTRPQGLTLDRVNSLGDYCQDNCQWVDYHTQNRKRSYALHLTYKGKTFTAKEWAYLFNYPYDCLQQRLKRGWSVEKTLTTPLQAQYARRSNETQKSEERTVPPA